MRLLITALFSVCSLSVLAEQKKDDWKKLVSTRGFEFSYPSCWILALDSPDAELPFETAKELAVIDYKQCSKPLRKKADQKNSVSVHLWELKDGGESRKLSFIFSR